MYLLRTQNVLSHIKQPIPGLLPLIEEARSKNINLAQVSVLLRKMTNTTYQFSSKDVICAIARRCNEHRDLAQKFYDVANGVEDNDFVEVAEEECEEVVKVRLID